jgi:hypothetical protein
LIYQNIHKPGQTGLHLVCHNKPLKQGDIPVSRSRINTTQFTPPLDKSSDDHRIFHSDVKALKTLAQSIKEQAQPFFAPSRHLMVQTPLLQLQPAALFILIFVRSGIKNIKLVHICNQIDFIDACSKIFT